MQVLAIFRVIEGADMERIQSLLLEEERFAWQAYLDGWLRQHYESDMPAPAISILEVESIEDAQNKLGPLPLLAEGLITVDLHELRPFKNWEVLFSPAEKIGTANQ